MTETAENTDKTVATVTNELVAEEEEEEALAPAEEVVSVSRAVLADL